MLCRFAWRRIRKVGKNNERLSAVAAGTGLFAHCSCIDPSSGMNAESAGIPDGERF